MRPHRCRHKYNNLPDFSPAAERVLPIWEAEYPADTRPMDAIHTTWRWLAGNASLDEEKAAYAATTDAVLDSLPLPHQEMLRQSAYPATTNVALAAKYVTAYVAFGMSKAFYVPDAVEKAAFAVSSGATVGRRRVTRQRFYRRWWSACRRRLAIYDVPAAEITWYQGTTTGSVGTREEWSKCRRRLAVYDVPSTEITWKEQGEEDI